jgi:MoaA/NifB/PqqE/SkfB family radical SAM enzyme
VYFAGGEPTLRKDLPVLVRAARDLDYDPIIVNTNGSGLGTLLGLPAWRTFLADVDTIIVSLDGLDLGWLARTWQTPRPEDVIESLLVLRALREPMRFRLAVNAVIQPGQTEHAADVLDLAGDLGLWFSPVPRNEGGVIAPGLADDDAYHSLAARILARKAAGDRVQGSARLNARLLSSAPLVCRNTLKPHVDHDGTLFWPCKASVDVPPLRVRVLDYPDVDALWEACTRRVDPARFSERCGARCNWAQNYSTDAYAHGLLAPWSLVGEVAEFLRTS